MPRPTLHLRLSRMSRSARPIALALAILFAAHDGATQNTPLLSGGVGFLTNTNAGRTTYTPLIEPLLAAPIGQRLLIESRAALLETFAPNGGGQPGYDHTHFVGLSYLQGDYIASPHLPIVGGSF